jgi:hypothetical protein
MRVDGEKLTETLTRMIADTLNGVDVQSNPPALVSPPPPDPDPPESTTVVDNGAVVEVVETSKKPNPFGGF